MRTSTPLFVLAATAIAALVYAQSETDGNTWLVVDSTTEDTSMSTPSDPSHQPVRCNAGLAGIGVKCSADSEYTPVPRGGNLTIECASTDISLHFVDLFDLDVHRSTPWFCGKKQQRVTIGGELSTCRNELRLTAGSACIAP